MSLGMFSPRCAALWTLRSDLPVLAAVSAVKRSGGGVANLATPVMLVGAVHRLRVQPFVDLLAQRDMPAVLGLAVASSRARRWGPAPRALGEVSDWCCCTRLRAADLAADCG